MVQNRRFVEDNEAPRFGRRHLQCTLLFFALFVAFASRVNLSVAIVAMTTSSSVSHSNALQSNNLNGTEQNKTIEYVWSEKTKSMVLSSFLWGYFVTQIPGGQLAHMFGSKMLILQSLVTTSFLTIFTPLAARYGGWKLLCAFRFVQGLSQGVLYPSAHTLISRWVPAEERGTLSTFAYQGGIFGTVAMLAISGTLASTYGWPSIFYVSGGMCVMATVATLVWGASSPSDCKVISAAEKLLIDTSLGKVQNEEDSHKSLKTPWKSIFTSVPFWALGLVHMSHNSGFWTLITQMPSYMNHVMGLDIKSNALLSALPYLALIVMGYIFCAISDALQRRQCLSLTVSRKLFSTISLWIPMISVIALGYVSANHVQLAVVLLVVTVGFNSAFFVGWNINHIELSPNFGGILYGFTNCAANFMGVLGPMLVGFVVSDATNPAQWRIVFYITGGFYFLGNLAFVLFGTSKVQPWNEPIKRMEELKFIKVPVEEAEK